MTFQLSGNEPKGDQAPTETPGQGQEGTPDAGYVTKKDLDEFYRKVDERLASLYRGVQSQTDRLDSRVQKRIEAVEKAAHDNGMTLSPSQKEQLTNQATLDELYRVSGSVPSGVASDLKPNQGETDAEFEKRVNAAAETMLQAAKIEFEDADPELELINKAAESGDANQYLAAHQEAIRLKLARLGNTGIQAQKRTPAAAVPGAITGGASVQKFSELTPDQQWELAKKSR